LDETLEEVLTVFIMVMNKCKEGLKTIKSEFGQILTHEPYQFDRELKYIIYRLCLELKDVIMICSSPAFLEG
jgi:hypothetical protein